MPSTPFSSEEWDRCIRPDDEPIVGVVVSHPIPQLIVGVDPAGDGWVTIGYITDEGLAMSREENHWSKNGLIQV